MKHTLYYIVFLLLAVLLPTGCSEDVLPGQEPSEETVTWRFSVLMPDARQATRTMGEYAAFDELYVAVFNDQENLNFLEDFAKATVVTTTPPTTDKDQLTTFEVTLKKTSEPRRIHLIGNYPGLTFPFGEEGQLVGKLKVDIGDEHNDAYWGRVRVNNIQEEVPAGMTRIPMVRNFAKVQLNIDPSVKNFKLTGFALHNVPQSGTVAPYNSTGGNFANFVASDSVCQTYDNLFSTQKYEGNEPYGVQILPLENKEENYHKPKQDGSVDPFYIYERRNRGAGNPTSVILRGKFSTSGNFDEVEETFYKLDLIYKDSESNADVYYNLLRNFVYTLNVKKITTAGYTFEQALEKPASNNVAASTDVEDFTNISDGKERLFVSTTYLLMTSGNPVEIYYRYVPDVQKDDTETNNTTAQGGPVTLTLSDGLVLKSATGDVVPYKVETADVDDAKDDHNDWRKVTLFPNNPSLIKESQTLTISAGGLQRKIELELVQPYVFNDVQAYPDEVLRVQKARLDVLVSIPTALPVGIFPLKFFIGSDKNTIYPVPGTGLYAETRNGEYGFVKELSWEEYESLTPINGSVTFRTKFQTNCVESSVLSGQTGATRVYADNDYFERKYDDFYNITKNQSDYTINIATSVKVNIQQDNSLWPEKIHANGANTGTENVTVTYMDENVGNITIDRDNVTKGLTITDLYGLPDKNAPLTFTFDDRYSYANEAWVGPMTYTATCTAQQLLDGGVTLNFTHEEYTPPTSLTVGTNIGVTVQKHNFRYPQQMYNSGSNSGTETVTVTYKGEEVGTITIDHDNVTSTVTLEYTEGFEPQEELTFVFMDNPYQGGGEWHAESPYTATCNVADMANGTAVLYFTTTVDLPWREIPLDGINVDIQRIMGRYPKQIYNTSANDGTESVSVSYNGQPLSSNVTIDRTSVHSGYITLTEGAFDATGTLTFTFKDAYWSYKNGFGWSDEKGYGATTYTVSCTVQDLMNGGVTLEFMTSLNGITLNNPVKVQTFTRSYTRYYQTYTRNVYPQNLENSEQGTEIVNVYHNGVKIAETSIYRERFYDQEFFIPIDGASSETITFEFSDQYCTSLSYNNNLNYTWNGYKISFKEEISIQDLNNGETVYFETDEIKMYNSIDIKAGNETVKTISIPKYNDDYYPKNITQGSYETVSVSYNGTNIGTIHIENSNNTLIIRSNATLSSDTALEESYELEFEFQDYYRNNNGYWWSERTYIATCTVGELINGTAQLEFTRQ